MKDINLGRGTIRDFLSAFFPEPNRPIFLRAFEPTNAPEQFDSKGEIKRTARAYKTTSTELPQLKAELSRLNKTHGVYFIVNSGGNSDKDITRYNAAFVENDNLPITQQHKKLDNAPLVPSIRVETKKSVHSYWLIDGECSEEEWREIQGRLIAYFDGDKTIKNPSRAMRLPYFNHVTYNETEENYEYKRVFIHTFDQNKRYTTEQLLKAFPEIERLEVRNFDSTVASSGDLPEWYEALKQQIITGHTKKVSDGYDFKCPICGTSPDGSAILFNDGKILCRKSRCKPIDMAKALGIDPHLHIGKAVSNRSTNPTNSTDSIDSSDAPAKADTLITSPRLSEKALYGKAGHIVKAIAKESEASAAALLIQFLTAYGNAVGFEPYCLTEADRQGTNLFALIVGKTARAGRKGTSWGNIERLFAEADENWTTDCLESNFLASGEGLINRLKDNRAGHDSPVSDKRLLLVEGEFGKVLNIMRRSGESLNSTLRNAFDRKTLGNGRSNDSDSKRATNPHVSMVAHITQNELKALLKEVEVHNGFLNRFLIAFTERKQKLALGGNFWRRDYSAYVNSLRSAIVFGKSVKNEIPLSKEAKSLWREIYDSYDDEEDAYIDAMTARAEAIMRRLQLIYALLDNSKVVDVPHVKAAKAVWDYCEVSVRYIFDRGLRLSKDAEKLYKAVKDMPEGLTRTQQFEVFKKAKRITADALDGLAAELYKAGLTETLQTPTKGRDEKILFDVGIRKDAIAPESVELTEFVELEEPKAKSATH